MAEYVRCIHFFILKYIQHTHTHNTHTLTHSRLPIHATHTHIHLSIVDRLAAACHTENGVVGLSAYEANAAAADAAVMATAVSGGMDCGVV
jgi:hypothetical protein